MISFSIVLPLYNKQSHIVRALNSIINQTYKNYEVIIINDGSSDNSEKVVRDWISTLHESKQTNFRIYSQKNCGVSCARNNGVKKSNYEYIAFLDCDDYWTDNHLYELKLLIDRFSTKVDIFSTYCIQLKKGRFIYPKLSQFSNYNGIVNYFQVSMISNGFVNSSSVCVKKEAILKYKFPKDMTNFEDVITWARIANHKGVAFSSKTTAVYIIENADASLNVNFSNYLKYEKLLLKEVNYNKMDLYKYGFKFLLIHLLYAKLNLDLIHYLKKAINIVNKSPLLSLAIIVSLFFPKFLLKKMRDVRKDVV